MSTLTAYAILSSCVFAETKIVSVTDFTYVPQVLEIQEGDTVLWQGVDDFHDVVSGVSPNPNGIFNSTILNRGNTYSFTFFRDVLNANASLNEHFPYYCQPHVDHGMVGTIMVHRVAKDLVSTLTQWQNDPTQSGSETRSCTFHINEAETDMSVSCDGDTGGITSLTVHEGLIGATGSTICDLGATSSGSCVVNHEIADDLLSGNSYVQMQFAASAPIRGQLVKIGGNQSVQGKVMFRGVVPLSGVTVSDGVHTAKTQIDGSFTLVGVTNGIYKISAVREGFTISPDQAVSPYLVNSGDVINRDFTALPIGEQMFVVGDIDGDERPDPILATKSGILYQGSADNVVKTITGITGDTVIAGAFHSPGVTEFAAINKVGKLLSWNIYDHVGQRVKSFPFGSVSTIPITGCDINGDGLTDVVIKQKKTLLYSTDLGATQQSVPVSAQTRSWCTDNIADQNIDIDINGDGLPETGKVIYFKNKPVLSVGKKRYALGKAKIVQLFRYRERNNKNGLFIQDEKGSVLRLSFPEGSRTKTALPRSKGSQLVMY